MKRPRIIDTLRRKWPELRWSYDRDLHRWSNSGGWYVEAFASYTPRYEGDDDEKAWTVFYCRSDTGQELYGLRDGAVLQYGKGWV